MGPDPKLDMLSLITTAQLASAWGFARPNSSFVALRKRLNVEPIAGTRGKYDPQDVRRKMDQAQSSERHNIQRASLSLVEQRKLRRGEQ